MEWKFSKYRYGKVIRYTAYWVRDPKQKGARRSYHFQTPEACRAFCRARNIPLAEGWEEPLPGTKILRPLK